MTEAVRLSKGNITLLKQTKQNPRVKRLNSTSIERQHRCPKAKWGQRVKALKLACSWFIGHTDCKSMAYRTLLFFTLFYARSVKNNSLRCITALNNSKQLLTNIYPVEIHVNSLLVFLKHLTLKKILTQTSAESKADNRQSPN